MRWLFGLGVENSEGLYVMAVGCMEAFCGWLGLEVMDWDRIRSMVDIPQQLDKAKGNLCTSLLWPSIPSSELLMNGKFNHCTRFPALGSQIR
jgi:hypothetical protein